MAKTREAILLTGVRPNFMRTRPVARQLGRDGGSLNYRIIHTSHHYDTEAEEIRHENLD